MPSANPNSKLEKQASTEALDPIRQAITVIEHKIRNLEKRKGKLEQYRDIVKNGGELNADQKTAVAKYDEVQQTLENMRDLYKQINGIASDAQRQQKKLARVEALERVRQDIAKVREVLLIQDTLMNMGAQGVRHDFIKGVNGAIQLPEEEVKFLDDLYNEVMLKHEKQEGDVTFMQQAQKVAEHYVHIVDGKQREVVGTTYAKIKEVITSIVQCGYFDQASEVAVEEVTKVVAETHITNTQPPEQPKEDFNSVERHIPPPPEAILPTIQAYPVPVAAIPIVSGAGPALVAQAIPAMQAPADPSYYTSAPGFVAARPVQQPQQQQQQQPLQEGQRIDQVIGPAPNFYFLQDSELEPPADASNAGQAPPVVSHIPPLPVVPPGPVAMNAPIPTQTFTNQTFTGPPGVPPQVLYQHQPPQDLSQHMPPFSNANAPPPIPMPQPHQASMQFSQQSQSGFQQQQPPQGFEHVSHQESLHKEEGHDNAENLASNTGEKDVQNNETSDWGQMADASNDWSQVEQSPPSNQDQNTQQAWGNRGGYRGRGRGRGNPNSYNNRGRGSYQQNGRGSYYNRNSSSDGGNYQNGYQRNNWSNNGGDGSYQPSNGGYKTNFNRNNSQPRGERRDGDRSGMDRGGRGGGGGGGGGQYRGNPRGANRTNYVPRGKPQTQN